MADARARRDKWRKVLLDGQNPIEVRKAGKSVPVTRTFGQCADELIRAKSSEWRNEKHRQQWRVTLQGYCKSRAGVRGGYGGYPVDPGAALAAHPGDGRVESVLSYAAARGWRAGPNPALWRGGLDQILPKRQNLTVLGCSIKILKTSRWGTAKTAKRYLFGLATL